MRTVLPAPAALGGRAVGTAFIVRRPGSCVNDKPDDACSPAARAGISATESTGAVDPLRGERERFQAALEAARSELNTLARENSDEPAGAVFAAHLEMLEDPMLEEQVEAALAEGEKAPEAVSAAEQAICAMFADIDDEYLRARVDDVHDICRRIRAKLTGADAANPFASMPNDAIIVAEELSPSDAALMDFSRVRAFVTARGSVTSHICIIARSKGIPVLLGVDLDALAGLVGAAGPGDDEAPVGHIPNAGHTPDDGLRLLVDAPARRLIVDPSPEDLASFPDLTSGPQCNLLGPEPYRHVTIYANAGSLEDVRRAMAAGAEGIGVFRTEFLFMLSKAMPTEEQQFQTYREAALLCKGKHLTIRTLDIGGDKRLPYLTLPREDNPFLGLRALRLCLARPEELFKPQLRAILRASAFGNVRILLPMVTSVDEVRKVRALLRDCMQELDEENVSTTAPSSGHPYDPAIPVGVMIETPAAVLIAADLAREADFFSIGTNDLTQYILAADRDNPAMAPYYDSFHPAVLRAIAMTVAAAGVSKTPSICSPNAVDAGPVSKTAAICSPEADARGGDSNAGRRIPVGVCGEMAADPEAARVLADLGVDELSLSSAELIAQMTRS